MEHELNWIYCPDCNQTLLFECEVKQGGEGLEKVFCPWCNALLEEIRADGYCDCIGIACGHLYPGKPCCG